MKAPDFKIFTEIASRINSTDDINSLLDEIMTAVKSTLDVEGCSLLLYKKERDALVFNVSKGDKKEFLQSLEVPRGKGIAGMVLETLKPEIVNDAVNDQRIYKSIDATTGFVTRNLACVAMIAQGEVQGVLEAVNTNHRKGFHDSDIDILKSLSDLAAIAIKNRIMIDQLNSRNNELNCLFQLSVALRDLDSLPDFLNLTVTTLEEVLELKEVGIAFWDKGEVNSDLRVGDNWTDSSEKIKEILYSFTKGTKYFQPSPNQMYLPIQKRGVVEGLLYASDKITTEPFDESDLKLMTTIAGQVSEAYVNILEKEKRIKLRALERDMQVASQIQLNSLPNIPTMYAGLEFSTHYQASRDIGGDFYEMVIHSPSEVSIMIADVSGKGTPAALFMELSKTVIASEVSLHDSPSKALAEADAIIQNKSRTSMFVTVMLTRIDTERKKIIFASAGHNEQILYRSREKKYDLLVGKGTPIGITKSNYADFEIEYEKGDLLILYTDGVTECMNEKEELFGIEALLQIIEERSESSVPEIKNAILKATSTFQGKASPHDDLTMVLVRL